MSTPLKLTVVYTINDLKAFESTKKDIFDSLSDYDLEKPPAYGVTAVANADEIFRLQLIEEALEVGDSDWACQCINFIVNHANISEFKSFEDVLKVIE